MTNSRLLSMAIALSTASSAASYPFGLRVDEHKKTDPYAPSNRSKGEKKRNKSARYVK